MSDSCADWYIEKSCAAMISAGSRVHTSYITALLLAVGAGIIAVSYRCADSVTVPFLRVSLPRDVAALGLAFFSGASYLMFTVYQSYERLLSLKLRMLLNARWGSEVQLWSVYSPTAYNYATMAGMFDSKARLFTRLIAWSHLALAGYLGVLLLFMCWRAQWTVGYIAVSVMSVALVGIGIWVTAGPLTPIVEPGAENLISMIESKRGS